MSVIGARNTDEQLWIAMRCLRPLLLTRVVVLALPAEEDVVVALALQAAGARFVRGAATRYAPARCRFAAPCVAAVARAATLDTAMKRSIAAGHGAAAVDVFDTDDAGAGRRVTTETEARAVFVVYAGATRAARLRVRAGVCATGLVSGAGIGNQVVEAKLSVARRRDKGERDELAPECHLSTSSIAFTSLRAKPFG